VLDTYLLSSSCFICALAGEFVLMFHVFTFFELLSDVIRITSHGRVFAYCFFLCPLIFASRRERVDLVLVVFGVLTRNEVTAFKACGVSMYGLALPILAADFC